jgi:hypothetical protein
MNHPEESIQYLEHGEDFKPKNKIRPRFLYFITLLVVQSPEPRQS